MKDDKNSEEPCITNGAQFLRERLTQLVTQKDVSAYSISYSLGNSNGYINSILSGRALPKMGQFFKICDYFGITPQEFFDPNLHNPTKVRQAAQLLETLTDEELDAFILLLQKFKERNPNTAP